MQTNSDTLITIFGGSGFLGRHVVRALAKRRYRIRVAVRRPELAGFLQPLGTVGQITAVQANLRYPRSVEAAVRDADIVINLVGILFERGRQNFEAVQHFGAEQVALAATASGARVIHVSAIGADEKSSSLYAQSKAKGEQAVRAASPDAMIVRPSIVFGPEDEFFNRFASMARMLPFLPLIGGGETKFQPVFVGDIAEAIATAVEKHEGFGTTYEFGGPEVKTFRELMEFVLATTERKRLLLPVPFGLAKLKASFLQYLPNPLLTPDQVELLRHDNVVSARAIHENRTLSAFGIVPAAYEAIVPNYLWRFRKTGQFRTGRFA
ncbi:complex I NDUFA9 subunit family protein [Pseudorhodoplanes sinuspersici]|uniref:Complex I NDUFA9 subunit family protein n=1 Tax=Pseudorhodoplanes sinuspersici TaxID=1235591 RepID=A0A1W7A053_9HYPH|nr:complex I NDUFA9 subunit family protein [Pseudorhodoplanes sinuspersici]ARQ02761.1 complex I NDUFA9 subunit family protein [Pseudorhodoplanes sinuspersici]